MCIFTVPPLICPSQGIILKSTFYAYFLDVHLSSTDGLEVHVGAVEGSVWWPNCSHTASGGLFCVVLGSGGSMDNGSSMSLVGFGGSSLHFLLDSQCRCPVRVCSSAANPDMQCRQPLRASSPDKARLLIKIGSPDSES